MSEVPHHAAGDDGGLGALLALLSGAADSFRTVHVTYRIWRHEQRLQEAFHAHVEAQKRRGGMFFAAVPHGGDPGPAETKETIRIWRAGQQMRQEHHGGWRDGAYGVIDGPHWWSWSEQMGAMSGHGNTNFGGYIDRGFEVILNPAPLVSWLDLTVAGESRVASRATVTAHAAATRQEGLRGVKVPSDPRMFLALGALGVGADSYRLEVDRERGVLLAVTAVRDEQPFSTITTLAVGFDEPIPAETFQFTAPEGEQIRSLAELFPRPTLVSLAEAQRRAPFTVLVPDHLPTGWRQMLCRYAEASERFSASVSLVYRSDTGYQNVTIRQIPAADAPRHYGMLFGDQSWEEVRRNGTLVKIRPAGERQPKPISHATTPLPTSTHRT